MCVSFKKLPLLSHLIRLLSSLFKYAAADEHYLEAAARGGCVSSGFDGYVSLRVSRVRLEMMTCRIEIYELKALEALELMIPL